VVERQLKDAIRRSGKTLTSLARESGVPTPSQSRFLNGYRSLSLPTASKLCATLRLGLAPLPPGASSCPQSES
jgi:hypothetical protein